MTALDLSHNQITLAGAEALIASPYLTKARIDLSNNQFGENGVAVLRQRFGERLES